jgi:hypothetical protein
MLDFYNEHKTEFDRLADMFIAEKDFLLVYGIYGRCETIDRTSIPAGENEKCAEYVRLFKSLEIDWAYINRTPVYLSVYTWGLTGHGLTKGYMFAPDTSTLSGVMVKDTGTRGNQMPRYKKIDENWFIFFK